MLLHRDFEAALSRHPMKVALVCGAAQHTYSDVDLRAREIALALEQRGIRRGDRVALFLDNGIEFVAGVVAILRIGSVFMPINPLTKGDKLAYMLADARASALLTSDVLAPV